MTEEKNEVIFDDDKISKSEEFVNPDELYQELIQCVQKYHPSDDISMIEKAYKVASEAHKNQFRKSGEPYIIHPLNVAIILADLKLDKETIVAGILPDVVRPLERRHVVRAYADFMDSDDASLTIGPELMLKDEHNEWGKKSRPEENDPSVGLGMQFSLDF